MSEQNPTPPSDGQPGVPPTYGSGDATPPTGGQPQYQAPTPPPAYGQPQYGASQQGYNPGAMTPSDENTWAALAHFGGIVLGFLAPLIVMLVKGPESPRVRSNAVEALNFQISIMIYMVISMILVIVLIGFLTAIATGVAALVLSIIAGVKALGGEDYRYPLTIRLVK